MTTDKTAVSKQSHIHGDNIQGDKFTGDKVAGNKIETETYINGRACATGWMRIGRICSSIAA